MAIEFITILDADGNPQRVAVDKDATNSDNGYQTIKVAFGADGTFTLVTGSVGLPVSDAGGSLTVDAPAASPVFVRFSDGTNPMATVPVSVSVLPLPSGGSTSANQATEIAALASIDAALGTLLTVAATDAGLTAIYNRLAGATISGALPAGTNTIGAVSQGTSPWVTGVNSIGGVGISLGPKAAASAFPVAFPTDQGVSITGVAGGTISALAAATISGALPAGTNLLGVAVAPHQTGAVYAGTTPLTPKFAAISASSSGLSTAIPAAVGKKIRVLSYRFQSDADVSVKFRDNTAGVDLTGAMATGAKGGGGGAAFSPVGHFETGVGNALSISLSGAVQVSGHACYIEV